MLRLIVVDLNLNGTYWLRISSELYVSGSAAWSLPPILSGTFPPSSLDFVGIVGRDC